MGFILIDSILFFILDHQLSIHKFTPIYKHIKSLDFIDSAYFCIVP